MKSGDLQSATQLLESVIEEGHIKDAMYMRKHRAKCDRISKAVTERYHNDAEYKERRKIASRRAARKRKGLPEVEIDIFGKVIPEDLPRNSRRYKYLTGKISSEEDQPRSTRYVKRTKIEKVLSDDDYDDEYSYEVS